MSLRRSIGRIGGAGNVGCEDLEVAREHGGVYSVEDEVDLSTATLIHSPFLNDALVIAIHSEEVLRGEGKDCSYKELKTGGFGPVNVPVCIVPSVDEGPSTPTIADAYSDAHSGAGI